MDGVEGWLLEGRAPRYVQLATAAAPEGQRSLDHWHGLGRAAADRLGVEQVVLDVRTRDDAHDARWIDALDGAGLVYLSGGNPTYLADTLRGTPLWDAIVAAWRSGASLAGCSAGAMAMGGFVPNHRHPRTGGALGLGIVPGARVLPHFDRYTRWMPDFALRPLLAPGSTVLGIDEDTALVAEPPPGDAREGEIRPWAWGVRGRQRAFEVTRSGPVPVDAGLVLGVAG